MPETLVVLRLEQSLVVAFESSQLADAFLAWYSNEAQVGTLLRDDAYRYALARSTDSRSFVFDLADVGADPASSICSLLGHLAGHIEGASLLLVRAP